MAGSRPTGANASPPTIPSWHHKFQLEVEDHFKKHSDVLDRILTTLTRITNHLQIEDVPHPTVPVLDVQNRMETEGINSETDEGDQVTHFIGEQHDPLNVVIQAEEVNSPTRGRTRTRRERLPKKETTNSRDIGE